MVRPSVSWSLQVLVDLGDQVGVVGAGLVEPEDGGRAGGAGPGDGELDPVADRLVLGLAGPPDVAGLDGVRDQHVAGGVDDLDGAGGRDLEGLVVRAVLLGRLGHQADVGDRAHRGGVEGAVGPAVVEHGLVDAGVGRVRDDREGVGLLAVGTPHVAGLADHRGHRRVDDDVGGHVQVGDALVGVDHGHLRAVGETLGDRRGDRLALGQRGGGAEQGAEPVVGRDLGGPQHLAVLLEERREERLHRVPEQDRVRDLHHRGLEVEREQHVVGLGAGDLLGEEPAQRGDVHERPVDDLTREHGHATP